MEDKRGYLGPSKRKLDPKPQLSPMRRLSRVARQRHGLARTPIQPWGHMNQSQSLLQQNDPRNPVDRLPGDVVRKRPLPGSVLARLEARRQGLAANKAERRRVLSTRTFAGFIFGCTNKTEQECLRRGLFGLPPNNMEEVKNVSPGTPLFLFNYEERVLIGVFAAATHGSLNIVPDAWGGNYPAQVKVQSPSVHRRIPEKFFKPLLADNYFSGHKFLYRLEHEQVIRLCRLFNQKPPKVPAEGRNPGSLHAGRSTSTLPYKKSSIMNPAVVSPKDGKLFGGLRGVTITPDSVQSPDITMSSRKEPGKSPMSTSHSTGGMSPPISNQLGFGFQDPERSRINQVGQISPRLPLSQTGPTGFSKFQFGPSTQDANAFGGHFSPYKDQIGSAMDISPIAHRPSSFSIESSAHGHLQKLHQTPSGQAKRLEPGRQQHPQQNHAPRMQLSFDLGGSEPVNHRRVKGFWSQRETVLPLGDGNPHLGNVGLGLNQNLRSGHAEETAFIVDRNVSRDSPLAHDTSSLNTSAVQKAQESKPFMGRIPLEARDNLPDRRDGNGSERGKGRKFNSRFIQGAYRHNIVKQDYLFQHSARPSLANPKGLRRMSQSEVTHLSNTPTDAVTSKRDSLTAGKANELDGESPTHNFKTISSTLDYAPETGSDLESLLVGTEDLETAFGQSQWETGENEFLVTSLHKSYVGQKSKASEPETLYDSDDHEHVQGMPLVSAHHIAKTGVGKHSSLWSERCLGGIVGVHGGLLKRKRELLVGTEPPSPKKSKRTKHFLKVASGYYSDASSPEQIYKNMVHNRLGFFWRSSTPKAFTAMKMMREDAISSNRQHLFDQVMEESGFLLDSGFRL